MSLPTISADVDLSAFGKTGPSAPALGNIKLIEMLMPLNYVIFDQNPKNFTVTKASMASERPAAQSGGTIPSPGSGSAGGSHQAALGTRATTVKFLALLDDDSGGNGAPAMLGSLGGSLKGRCDLLLNWSTAGPSSIFSAAAGAVLAAFGVQAQVYEQQPVLILQWGDPLRGHMMMGRLSAVTINYKRFNHEGNPLRAEADITFKEIPLGIISLLTNPTSGGVPGRKGHTLTQGENLQQLAVKNYGRAGAWRDVAASNGIDDPFRVRPGQKLLLPPRHEAIRG